MKKLIIFGSNGMVGTSFPRYHENIEMFRYHRKELDITNTTALENVIKTIKPDYVLNLAGYTNVPLAEKEREKCFSVNTYAAYEISKLCDKYDVHYIAVSTCGIFFNDLDSFDEDCTQKNTKGIYNLSKYEKNVKLK